MRHAIFLTLFSFLITSILSAQERGKLLVYEVKGSAQLQSGKARTPLAVSQQVTDRDILVLGADAMLVLLNPHSNQRYTLKGSYSGTARSYVQRNGQQCAKSVTAKYMNYLISQTFRSKKASPAQHEDSHATVFREGDSMLDTDDSIMVSVKSMDSLYHTIDSLTIVTPDTIQAP